jgi:hypothetical protein
MVNNASNSKERQGKERKKQKDPLHVSIKDQIHKELTIGFFHEKEEIKSLHYVYLCLEYNLFIEFSSNTKWLD